MASVLPLLLVAGAAVILLGGKKKKATAKKTRPTGEWSRVIDREGSVASDQEGRDIHWRLNFHFRKLPDGSDPQEYGDSDYYRLDLRSEQSGEWQMARDPYKTGWGPLGSMQQYDVRDYGSEEEILNKAESYIARIAPGGDIYISIDGTSHKSS